MIRPPRSTAKNALRAATLAVLACVVTGCNQEAAQRKAFIVFLHMRVIGQPGMHAPHLTADEAKSFGIYAQQYAIIVDFDDALDRSVAMPLQSAIKRGAVHSIDDIVTRHDDFAAARDGIEQLRAAIETQLAAADAAHAALKQPDNLKAAFDKAYERDVTIPAKAFADLIPDLSQALTAIVDLGDFLEQHKDQVTISGSVIETSDPELQPQLTALIAALTARNQAIAKATERLREVAAGG
jgi:hypothetical protein